MSRKQMEEMKCPHCDGEIKDVQYVEINDTSKVLLQKCLKCATSYDYLMNKNEYNKK